MATTYTFPVIYTKLGIATAPSSAPTIQIVDKDDNELVAAATAVTAITKMPGAYYYSYDGADNLVLWALFHTSDATVDQQDIGVYTPMQTYKAVNDIATVDGIVDSILEDTGTTIPNAMALEATLTAIKGAGWTTETLAAIDVLIDAIKAKTDNLPATPADDTSIDTQLATIAGYLDTEVAAILADTNELQTDLTNGGRLDLLVDAIKAKTDNLPVAGSGAITWVYNLLDGDGNPLEGASMWVTTDLAGTNVIASALTDSSGNVTFYLDAGTYYIWGQKDGYNFDNPDQEVIA